MPYTASMLVAAGLFSSLCSITLAHSVPLNLESREICVEDTIYLALQEFLYDADPWCRKELGINDVSVTIATVTARTTTTFTKTTTLIEVDTTTVPSSTVTISSLPLPLLPVQKREPKPEIAAFQRLAFIQSINEGSASEALYADVIRACKCLRLRPRIDYVVATVSATRTIRAVDYRPVTSYVTVTAGVATVYSPPRNVTLVPSVIPVNSTSTLLGISYPTVPASTSAKSNQSSVSETAILLVPSTLVGTGLPLSSPVTQIPSNITLTVTVSPIPLASLNLTKSVSTGLVAVTGLPSNFTSLKVSSLPSNITKIVAPTVGISTLTNLTATAPIPTLTNVSATTPITTLTNVTVTTPITTLTNVTVTTPFPTLSSNSTTIPSISSVPAINGSTLIDFDLLIRDPRLPAICKNLFSAELNPVRTVLSTIVSTTVKTSYRTAVRTSVRTSVITSIKTAIIPRGTFIN